MDEPGWTIKRIGKLETTLLLVSKLHPYAARKAIAVDELKKETFITLGDDNPTTDYFVQKLCGAYGFKLKQIIKANYFTRISHLKQNDGVVLISAWKNNAVHSNARVKFLDTVLDYYQNM
ncbi:LysR family transcriptional regulator substrate-binding protein [Enterocloster clostridioformis]|uniref:LysR family transcriptional regulator substrate-binding protein n=1 Tax=Enterocloster clostridioformis TaxID=1531 RepID=UPI0009BFA49D